MAIAREMGQSGRIAFYQVPDDELAVGSTLGGPKVATIIKSTGAIEKVYSIDAGLTLLGTLVLRHYDESTTMHLAQQHSGTFLIHPEHQEHIFTLESQLEVHEDIFVLNTGPHEDDAVDPPAVYYTVRLRNAGYEPLRVSTYAFVDLRGDTEHDIQVEYDRDLRALVAWNESSPQDVRVIACSTEPKSFEATLDFAKSVSKSWPGQLSNDTKAIVDPLGVLHLSHALEPDEQASFYFLITFSHGGKNEAKKVLRSCPDAHEALDRTRRYYAEIMSRSTVLTPDPVVNSGVLWAKADMLRVETKAPTGWCFTNDPTRSNNSVGRDTAWFGFGADYLTPEFAREALRAYMRLQQPSGKIIEYYDIRNGRTEDYGLNINDNTPLLILALWHHYNATGDKDFLREVYPAAIKAARYILSQRNEQGLVWCNAKGTGNWGIVGWRNVIPSYRLSGATTEVNSECYRALETVSYMARELEKHEESKEFAQHAAELKEAINRHLYNPENGLYYLNIDLDGSPRSDITADLVFPVMFGVADDNTAANIIARLSGPEFWTESGIRTVPRDSVDYTPNGGWGLLGGVWVGVSFWYAFAAARYTPGFMAHALHISFRCYSSDPRHRNTVPGQFSEWLHGETLVNQGMMLSPWFPPRYLWAAIEGVAGLDITGSVRVQPKMPPDWKWLAAQKVPYRGHYLTWVVVRAPDILMYTNFQFQESTPYLVYEQDITPHVRVSSDAVCPVGLRQGDDLLLFAGNTARETVNIGIHVELELSGEYRLRAYNSLFGQWQDMGRVPAQKLQQGMPLQIERKGFVVLDLKQEV
ncbi:Glycogen debranching protein-like protein [Thermobaculum terrenum ATCC BAA-798]|uniref:Glycogen debranching protein-like protein n=1 Tax=Thermobaculum terrenum (strain ATCC BAA-798 / CCMEE 7001 / YNP1) TaxID=525904 RepID=D1CGZ9_THET1|nr:amylo-alpha-1,6-glucosidase [Thermobaculum terrenum]ACZ43020.1 Glycogen debranching protein-like protein [Thermobaculum terrenum ATCC BAA-798]